MTTEEFSQAVQEWITNGWDEAIARKWTIVSVRDDWNTVFPTVKQASR